MSVWGAPKAAAEEADAAPSEFPTLGGAKEAFPSLGMAAQVRLPRHVAGAALRAGADTRLACLPRLCGGCRSR
jgi:hypothetical protein